MPFPSKNNWTLEWWNTYLELRLNTSPAVHLTKIGEKLMTYKTVLANNALPKFVILNSQSFWVLNITPPTFFAEFWISKKNRNKIFRVYFYKWWMIFSENKITFKKLKMKHSKQDRIRIVLRTAPRGRYSKSFKIARLIKGSKVEIL